MKNILLLTLTFLLISCAPQQDVSIPVDNTPIEMIDTNIDGEEVDIYMFGYEEMCEREPESELCNGN